LRLLEWETTAAHAARGGRPRARTFLVGMMASPSIAVGGFLIVVIAHPGALGVAVPILALWAIAPLIAFALSRPVPRRRTMLTVADRESLTAVARKTWRYFEPFAGDEEHGLPPDSVQVAPELIVAHRTSPTNIGIGLLATL